MRDDKRRSIPIIGVIVVVIALSFFFDVEKIPISGSGNVFCIVNKSTKIKRGRMAVVSVDNHEFATRIVALAGDTLEIIDGETFINGSFADENRRLVAYFNILPDTPRRYLREMERAINQAVTDTSKFVNLPIVQREENWKNYTWCPLVKNYPDERVYPYDIATHWNAMHFGQIVIPKKGMKMEMTAWNVLIYSKLIETHEHRTVQEGETYTFRKDYCFYLNDNRNFCNDCRVLGPIPVEKVVGKIIVKL